ncbi:MAG: hypothetical protein QOJ07_344 [Thermoleophilaceae bacterium]|nr:hypothetical protein [Thermoleophilaceae bacterium]
MTNGDALVPAIERAAPGGRVLPWRDVLHEGPVPGGLSEAALRAERALFLARAGWGDGVSLLDGFERRDQALIASRGDLMLWFDDDLFDQLQLVQVLAMLDARIDPDTTYRLVRVPRTGLNGHHDEIRIGAPGRRLARRAWAAFRSSDPRLLPAIEGPELPDLGPALRRLAEELPWTTDGLARTERQVLGAIGGGADTPLEVFRASQGLEDRPFMGDHWLWVAIQRLAECAVPLVVAPVAPTPDLTAEFVQQRYALTPAGERVLAGEGDHAALNGVERWLGGVRLSGNEPAWRWDPGAREVVGAS